MAYAHSIKHVIVLMEENRSFDHLFGWASHLLGINGLQGGESNPTSTINPNASEAIFVEPNAQFFATCDPHHETISTTMKLFGLKNLLDRNYTECSCGFVEAELVLKRNPTCAKSVMGGLAPKNVPVFISLAQEYAIMDRFFASLPGPTWPNRQFFLAATSGGSTETFNWYQGNGGSLFPGKLFFDQIDDEGLTWAQYYVDTPWELFMDSLAKNSKNIRLIDEFFSAARTGDLPNYIFINPRSAINVTTQEGSNDMHPDHDTRLAENFVKDIYEAVRQSPAWNDTLLVVTFDEHGGFYDHVLPPTRDIPPPDDTPAEPDTYFKFDRLGIRIATLLISPWINKGTVISAPPPAQKPFPSSEYELTSIMATVRKLFNMSSPPLTRRDAWAATFEHALLQRSDPRADAECPLEIASLSMSPDERSAIGSAEAGRQINDLQDGFLQTHYLLHGYDMPHDVARAKDGRRTPAAVVASSVVISSDPLFSATATSALAHVLTTAQQNVIEAVVDGQRPTDADVIEFMRDEQRRMKVRLGNGQTDGGGDDGGAGLMISDAAPHSATEHLRKAAASLREGHGLRTQGDVSEWLKRHTEVHFQRTAEWARHHRRREPNNRRSTSVFSPDWDSPLRSDHSQVQHVCDMVASSSGSAATDTTVALSDPQLHPAAKHDMHRETPGILETMVRRADEKASAVGNGTTTWSAKAAAMVDWYWLLNMKYQGWNVSHANYAAPSTRATPPFSPVAKGRSVVAARVGGANHTDFIVISNRGVTSPSVLCLTWLQSHQQASGIASSIMANHDDDDGRNQSDGHLVGVTPCYPSADASRNLDVWQQWIWTDSATIRPVANRSLCVTTHVWSGDSRVRLQPCEGTVEQHWMYQGPSYKNVDTGMIQFGNGIYSIGITPDL